MIVVNGQPVSAETLLRDYPSGGIESKIITILSSDDQQHRYDSIGQLKFELSLRKEIVNAANALPRSGIRFKVFRESTVNPDYWIRTPNGGFSLKPGVKPSDAIRDIFKNGSLYGTECATAMLIVYYKALLEVFGEEKFNRIFSTIYLMNWSQIDRNLQEVGNMRRTDYYLPGDRRYFSNPDVDPVAPEWQGENVIDMGDGTFYGHGVGRYQPGTFIMHLNGHRIQGADETAYLMSSAGRPDFNRLYQLYSQS